jgi:hypothetical protein
MYFRKKEKGKRKKKIIERKKIRGKDFSLWLVLLEVQFSF